jgi:hypothetical protein
MIYLKHLAQKLMAGEGFNGSEKDSLAYRTLMIELIVRINYKSTHPMPQNCCSCKIKDPVNTWKGIILTPIAAHKGNQHKNLINNK